MAGDRQRNPGITTRLQVTPHDSTRLQVVIWWLYAGNIRVISCLYRAYILLVRFLLFAQSNSIGLWPFPHQDV
jgi:hypothetical protein